MNKQYQALYSSAFQPRSILATDSVCLECVKKMPGEHGKALAEGLIE